MDIAVTININVMNNRNIIFKVTVFNMPGEGIAQLSFSRIQKGIVQSWW